jgi:hypothetical protein
MPGPGTKSKRAIERAFLAFEAEAGLDPALSQKIRGLLKLDTEANKICKRIRCENCSKGFMQKKPWARFCKDECRKQFHLNGSAFGKLKEQLLKVIQKETKAVAEEVIREEVARQNTALRDAVDALDGRLANLGHRFAQVVAQAALPKVTVKDALKSFDAAHAALTKACAPKQNEPDAASSEAPGSTRQVD